MASSWVLAVDFGTSNTAAAYADLDRGSVHTVALTHHGNLLPSCVYVESPDSILVGDVAADRAQTTPAAFVPAPKRVVGQGGVRAGAVETTDAALVAAVLHTAIGRAVAVHNGLPPQQLVLTHPAAWSPRQIQTLIDAAGQLGFAPDRVRTVSEPVAAAHYYTRTASLTPGQRIAVFDFGGGTLDVAVLIATDRGFDIPASSGDNRLGGRNLDAVLRQWVEQQLDDRDPDLLEHLRQGRNGAGEDAARALRNLDESIRAAKELLSEAPSATIDAAGGGMRETLQITRGEFDDIIGAQIDRGMLLTRTVFHDAGLTGLAELHKIYLTGGSTRIPLVHERLQQLGDVATLDDPKTVVVRGALDAVGATRAITAPRREPVTTTITPKARPSAASEPRKNRTLVTTALAAAIVAVLAAGAVYAFTRSGDDQSAAAPTPDGSASASPTTTGAKPVAKSANGVMAAIPPALERDSTCQQLGFTPEGAIQLDCDLRASASTTAGVSDRPSLNYTATVDHTVAETTLSNWSGDASGKLIGSKTGRAQISDSLPGNCSIVYANSDTGLNLTMRGFRDRDSAVTFLQRASLI